MRALTFAVASGLFSTCLCLGCTKTEDDSQSRPSAQLAAQQRAAKVTEARRALTAIVEGAKASYLRDTPDEAQVVFSHQFCPSAPPVPAKVLPGQKYQSVAASWAHPGWQCLRFNLNEPQRFQYAFYSNGKSGREATFTATAIGDVDGNGKIIDLRASGRIDTNGEVQVTFSGTE